MSKIGAKVATIDTSTKKRKSITTNTDDNDDIFLPQHIPVRVRNDNDISLKRPIICSFPGGLPVSITESTDNADIDQYPTFHMIKTIHTQPVQQQVQQSRKSSTTTGTSTTKSYIEHNLVGKDDSCYYSAHVTLPVVSKVNDNDNKNDTIDIDRTKIGYAKNQRSVMCVGIYDTHTNELVIHPTYANGNVFTIDQSVPTYKNTVNDNDENNNDRMKNPSTNAERYNALFADFGSKKKNKVIQSQRANQVRVATDNNDIAGDNNTNNTTNGVQSIVSDEFLQSMVNSSDPLSTRTKYMKEQRAISMAGSGGGNNNSKNNTDNDKLDIWRQQFLPLYDNEEKQSYRIYKLYPYVIGKNSYNYTNTVFNTCYTKGQEQNMHPIDILLLNSRTTLERIKVSPPPTIVKTENDNPEVNDEKNQQQQQQQQQSKEEIGEYWHESIRCILKNIQRKNPSIQAFEQQGEDDYSNTNDDEDNILTSTTITPRQQVLFCIILNQYMILLNTLKLLLKKVRSGTIYGPKTNKNYYHNVHIRIAKQFIQLFLSSNDTTSNTIYEQQYTFPKLKLDKCYTHLLLLYLLCDGGIMMKSDTIQNFINDINLDTNNAMIFLRQAGCKVLKIPIMKNKSSTGSKVSASLPKGPIVFPTNRTGKKK